MNTILIKHRKGSKTNQIETFSLTGFSELIFGRDSSAQVKFDPEIDDVVSRLHAKITQNPQNSQTFLITDLNSRNGTFVNGNKIVEPKVIQAGDIIQFGNNGPECEFTLDPLPQIIRSTREQNIPPSTRESEKVSDLSKADTDNSRQSATSRTIGQATLERAILQVGQENQQIIAEVGQKNRRHLINIAGVLTGLIILLAGGFFYWNQQNEIKVKQTQLALQEKINQTQKQSDKIAKEVQSNVAATQKTVESVQNTLEDVQKLQSESVSAAEIAEKYSDATVFIETSWKLVDTRTGKNLYHQRLCIKEISDNLRQDIKGAKTAQEQEKLKKKQEGFVSYFIKRALLTGEMDIDKKRCDDEQLNFAVYIKIGDMIEPFLTDELNNKKYNNTNQLLGNITGGIAGSGFVVDSTGYILTNRHVVAGWETAIGKNLPLPGVLYEYTKDSGLTLSGIIDESDLDSAENINKLRDWVPSKSKLLGGKPIEGLYLKGQTDYIYVTFPNTSMRIDAHLERISDKADVALIKINSLQPIKHVEIEDNYKAVKVGHNVSILGYPAVSPKMIVTVKSEDVLNRSDETKTVPQPTMTPATIGKIIEEKAVIRNTYDLRGEMGNSFQLTTNATGAGNSGGPVFNNAGKVIGLFTYSKTLDTTITFAVPIKYATDIMEINKITAE